MAQAKNPLVTYAHIRKLMDDALEAKNFIRINAGSNAKATKLRHNAYSLRTADRLKNQKIYSDDHPMYGGSVYDALTILIVDKDGRNCPREGTWVQFQRPMFDPDMEIVEG